MNSLANNEGISFSGIIYKVSERLTLTKNRLRSMKRDREMILGNISENYIPIELSLDETNAQVSTGSVLFFGLGLFIGVTVISVYEMIQFYRNRLRMQRQMDVIFNWHVENNRRFVSAIDEIQLRNPELSRQQCIDIYDGLMIDPNPETSQEVPELELVTVSDEDDEDDNRSVTSFDSDVTSVRERNEAQMQQLRDMNPELNEDQILNLFLGIVDPTVAHARVILGSWFHEEDFTFDVKKDIKGKRDEDLRFNKIEYKHQLSNKSWAKCQKKIRDGPKKRLNKIVSNCTAAPVALFTAIGLAFTGGLCYGVHKFTETKFYAKHRAQCDRVGYLCMYAISFFYYGTAVVGSLLDGVTSIAAPEIIKPFMTKLGIMRFPLIDPRYMLYSVTVAPCWEECVKQIHPIVGVIFIIKEMYDQGPFVLNPYNLLISKIALHFGLCFIPLYYAIPLHSMFNIVMFMGYDNIFFGTGFDLEVPTGTLGSITLSKMGELTIPLHEIKVAMSLRQLVRSRDLFDIVDAIFNMMMTIDPVVFIDVKVLDIVSYFDTSNSDFIVNLQKFWYSGDIYEPQDSNTATFVTSLIEMLTGSNKGAISNSDIFIKMLKVKSYFFCVIFGFLSLGSKYIPPSMEGYLGFLNSNRVSFSLADPWDVVELFSELKNKVLCYFSAKPEERNLLSIFSEDKLSVLLRDSLEVSDNIHNHTFLKKRYEKKSVFDCNVDCLHELEAMFKAAEGYLLKIPPSHPARQLLTSRCALIRRAKDVLIGGLPSCTRKEPQVIYCFGEPATLKTFASDYFIGVMLDAMDVDSPFDKRHICTAPLTKQAHENVYKGQRVYKFEEAFQAPSTAQDVENIPMFTIGATGTNPFLFNSADIASKGKNFLVCDVIGYASNVQDPVLSDFITDPGAFWRRLHYIIEISLLPEINGVPQIQTDKGYTFNPKTPTGFEATEVYKCRMLSGKSIHNRVEFTVRYDWCSLREMAMILHKLVYEKNQINIGRAIATDNQSSYSFCKNCGGFHPQGEFCARPVLVTPEETAIILPMGPVQVPVNRRRDNRMNRYRDAMGVDPIDYHNATLEEQIWIPPNLVQFQGLYSMFSHTVSNLAIGGIGVFAYKTSVMITDVMSRELSYYQELMSSWKSKIEVSSKIFNIIGIICAIGAGMYAISRLKKFFEPVPIDEQLGLATKTEIERVKALNIRAGAHDPEGWSKPTLKPFIPPIDKIIFAPKGKDNKINEKHKVLRQVVRLTMDGYQEYIHGIVICANALITNSHFFKTVPRRGLLRIEFRSDSGRSMMVFCEQISESCIRDSDGLSLIILHTTSCKSLVDMCIEDVSSIPDSAPIYTWCWERDLKSHFWKETKVCGPNSHFSISALQCSESIDQGRPGDCGSICVAEVAANHFVIVGIHEGRLHDPESQVILPLSQKILHNILSGVATQLVYPREDDSFSKALQPLIKEASSKAVQYHIPQGVLPMNVIGGIVGDAAHRKESKVEPTGYLACLYLVKQYGKPALVNTVLPDGSYFNPHLISYGHAAASPAQHIPRELIDYALSIMMADVEFTTKSISPLPMERVISGISDFGINGVNMSTAAGVPFSGLKDSLFSMIDPRIYEVIPKEKLLDEVDHIFDCYYKGISAAPVFRVALKDEVKKEGKPARQFFAGPTAFLLICKMYFEPIFSELRKMPFFTSMEGINCCDPKEVSKLVCDLLGIDELPFSDPVKLDEWLRSQMSILCSDCDYQKFDKVNFVAYLIMRAIVEKFIKVHPNYGTEILRGLLSDLFFALCVSEGVLYEVALQVLSGCFGVVLIQSMSELFYKTLVHIKCYEYEFGCRPTKSLMHYACLRNYGDDNVLSKPSDSHLSGANMTRAYKELRINVTNADKSEGDLTDKNIMDVEFLKRKFHVHDELGIVMRLNLESIAKSLCFWLPGKETFDKRMVSASMGAQRELVYWGRNIYDVWSSQMIEEFQSMSLPHMHFVSYDRMIELAKAPGFVTW